MAGRIRLKSICLYIIVIIAGKKIDSLARYKATAPRRGSEQRDFQQATRARVELRGLILEAKALVGVQCIEVGVGLAVNVATLGAVGAEALTAVVVLAEVSLVGVEVGQRKSDQLELRVAVSERACTAEGTGYALGDVLAELGFLLQTDGLSSTGCGHAVAKSPVSWALGFCLYDLTMQVSSGCFG